MSCLLFILLLPSVSPLSMSESSLPLAVIGVTVGISVFARTLLQVGRILSLIFAPCDPPSFCFVKRTLSPVALLKYLPLPSLSPATQSPSYLSKMCKLAVVRTLITVMLMLMMTTLLF